MTATIKSVLLNADGSGELWYGDGNAFVYKWYHKDVVALLGKELRAEGGKITLGVKQLGRLDPDGTINWVGRRLFLEAVSQ